MRDPLRGLARAKGTGMDVRLVMFKPDGQRKDFEVVQDSTIIGRGEDCGLRVPLAKVSRHHCELVKGDEELQVRDLGSSNGTYVNDERISQSVLKAGDRLSVGPVVFTVQVDGVPEKIKPPQAPAPAPKAAPAGGEDEEVVDLEADLAALEDEDEQADPIAALEALAAEHAEEDEENQENEDKQ